MQDLFAVSLMLVVDLAFGVLMYGIAGWFADVGAGIAGWFTDVGAGIPPPNQDRG